MCLNERLKEVVKFLQESNLIRNQQHLCDIIGYNKTTLSLVLNNKLNASTKLIQSITDAFPNISKVYIEQGEGKITTDFLPKQTSNTDLYTNNTNKMFSTTNNIEELPVIPANLVNEPNIDVFQYIIENETDRSPVVQQFPESAAYYRIKTRSMEPYICPGDMLALSPYPVGAEKIVPGDPYVVDTLTNGLVTRILYNHPDGYLARTYNSDRFTDFVINREDIIRIFRIVGLIRTNVQ